MTVEKDVKPSSQSGGPKMNSSTQQRRVIRIVTKMTKHYTEYLYTNKETENVQRKQQGCIVSYGVSLKFVNNLLL